LDENNNPIIVKNNILSLGKLLEEHKCENTVILDLSGHTSWTDGFIISTVTSQGHLHGVVGFIRESLAALGIPIFHGSKNIEDE